MKTYHERYVSDQQNGKHNAQWRYRKDNGYARAMLRSFPEFRSVKRIGAIVTSAEKYGDKGKAQAWIVAFDRFNTAKEHKPECAVCKKPRLNLDSNGVCPWCMLRASQALLTAADLWREPIADKWVHSHMWSDPDYFETDDLYRAANKYIAALIDWQDIYSTNVFNAELDLKETR